MLIRRDENGLPKKNPLSVQVDLSKYNKKQFEKASDEEKRQQDVMSESTTFLKDGIRRFKKNKLAMISLIILLAIIVIILIAPHIVPYGYAQIITIDGVRDKTAANLGPLEYSPAELEYMQRTGEHLFPHLMGTDSLCRDYFMRIVFGTRISLGVGCVAAIMVLIIGLIYGSISGYIGGKVDMAMMRVVDIIYSLPDMLMVILLSVVLKERLDLTGTPLASLGTNMISMFIVFALLYWVTMARQVRGQVMTIKNNEYVLAAKCIGTPNKRIIGRHILPNCLSVIIITTALQIPSAIFTESYLSFLGLGISAPMASLGSLANDARQAMQSYPSKLIFPAITICLIVLALNLIGDGLRDAFDSKLN